MMQKKFLQYRGAIEYGIIRRVDFYVLEEGKWKIGPAMQLTIGPKRPK